MITLEKSVKLIFRRNMRPKSVVWQSRKKLQILEIYLFQKKFLPAYLCRYDLQNGMRIIF